MEMPGHVTKSQSFQMPAGGEGWLICMWVGLFPISSEAIQYPVLQRASIFLLRVGAALPQASCCLQTYLLHGSFAYK